MLRRSDRSSTRPTSGPCKRVIDAPLIVAGIVGGCVMVLS